jgi:NADH-quinone oxidoreductase subunit I
VEANVEVQAPPEPSGSKYKKTTFGTGLLKGLAITMRHLLSRTVTVQYPDEKPDLPARTRGVIALKEETCTVCMLCARECPDWCIYIEGHKEERKPTQPGRRAKKYNVLDRFAIDYALCMYCGICVEVCPYDALFWSPEFEYAEHDVTEMTHELDKLGEWMSTVPPPDALDDGAEGPEFKSLAQRAAEAAPKTEPAPKEAVPKPQTTPKEEAAPKEETPAETPEPVEPTEKETPAPAEPEEKPEAPEEPPEEAPQEVQGVGEEEAEAIGQKVYEEEISKGADPRVAEARKKAAIIRARKGTRGPSG